MCGFVDDLIGSTDLLQENPITIARELATTMTGTSTNRLRNMLETRGQAHGKTYFVNGHICSVGCNVMVGMLPTNDLVHGFNTNEVPSWNILCLEEVEGLLKMAKTVLDDVGLLIFISSKWITQHVAKVCEPCGFKIHHLVTVACKTALGMSRGMAVRSSIFLLLHY